VTTPTGDPDAFWRRPTDDTPPAAQENAQDEPAQSDAPEYPGPPPTTPPPAGWRPPMEVRPAPPRELPPQDHTALDNEEQSARTITYGIGMVAGAILLIVVCALCSRVVF
jgi:hypothetical protein